jgi:16S rRNA (cytosine967-C5)-methyltransferase
MPADSTPSKSARTQLTDKPKLSLKPASANKTASANKKSGARKTGGANKTSGAKSPAGKPTANRSGAKKVFIKPAKTIRPSKLARKETVARVVASRRVCFDVLVAVAEGAQLDVAMSGNADLDSLEDRDRRFVQMLATTCLRRRGQLEKTIAPMMARRPFGAQENANIIMTMGAAQLLILKTEAHAAVDSTVELMREAGFDRLTGMANAVMRRLTREGEARFATTTPIDNLPDWLNSSWQAKYGADVTAALTALSMDVPPLDITPRGDASEWAERLDGKLINGVTIRREFDGDLTRLDGFAEGQWWVQDAAAALCATLFGDIAGKEVIDLCAAPGGKTAQLIAAGANVTAIDNGRKRIDRLRRNLTRLKMKANLVYGDGRTHQPEQLVDHILLDAPCSATGTLRRRPDILGRRTPENISDLQAIQWDLATTALGWLKPGGTMIYATCSLQAEEGEDMIAAILDAAKGGFALDPITPEQAGEFARSISDQGTMRIIPSDYADIGGVDGFYIARLKSSST